MAVIEYGFKNVVELFNAVHIFKIAFLPVGSSGFEVSFSLPDFANMLNPVGVEQLFNAVTGSALAYLKALLNFIKSQFGFVGYPEQGQHFGCPCLHSIFSRYTLCFPMSSFLC
ncbi:hypothetical protein [Nafulsella turpanensis]|uniref:hypothetical protein n=1 Tax=Nafulsella turpanensis TaxID=1265690 RepID=UPI001267CC31|nr:hypothetical protein [Nafulsella turpanensis]